MVKQRDAAARWSGRPLSCLVASLLVTGPMSLVPLAQQPFDPLSVSEIELAKAMFLSDARVKEHLADNARYRIVTVERHDEHKSEVGRRLRRADVVLYNYTKNETISAIVRVAGTGQVDALRVGTGSQPTLSSEETDEAQQLALAQPAVQSKLRSAGVNDATKGLIITHLAGRALDQPDACATDRCVTLFFNTTDALLFIAVVDLTTQHVYVQ